MNLSAIKSLHPFVRMGRYSEVILYSRVFQTLSPSIANPPVKGVVHPFGRGVAHLLIHPSTQDFRVNPQNIFNGAGEGIRTPEPLRDRSLWTHSMECSVLRSHGRLSPSLTWLGFREI